MVFAWNLEERRESGGVGVDAVSYSVGNLGTCQITGCITYYTIRGHTNMLVDEDDANVFPLFGEAVEGCFDS